jgi:hypothetical protein
VSAGKYYRSTNAPTSATRVVVIRLSLLELGPLRGERLSLLFARKKEVLIKH